jgi:hypothetical protein
LFMIAAKRCYSYAPERGNQEILGVWREQCGGD